jgi:hypothetical protein
MMLEELSALTMLIDGTESKAIYRRSLAGTDCTCAVFVSAVYLCFVCNILVQYLCVLSVCTAGPSGRAV